MKGKRSNSIEILRNILITLSLKECSILELSKIINTCWETTKQHLNFLIEINLIKKIGHKYKYEKQLEYRYNNLNNNIFIEFGLTKKNKEE